MVRPDQRRVTCGHIGSYSGDAVGRATDGPSAGGCRGAFEIAPGRSGGCGGVVGLGFRVGRNSMVVGSSRSLRRSFVRAVAGDGPVAPAVGEHAPVLTAELLEALLWIGGGVEASIFAEAVRIRQRRSCSRRGMRRLRWRASSRSLRDASTVDPSGWTWPRPLRRRRVDDPGAVTIETAPSSRSSPRVDARAANRRGRVALGATGRCEFADRDPHRVRVETTSCASRWRIPVRDSTRSRADRTAQRQTRRQSGGWTSSRIGGVISDGTSTEKIGIRCGASSQSHSMIRSKNERIPNRCGSCSSLAACRRDARRRTT